MKPNKSNLLFKALTAAARYSLLSSNQLSAYSSNPLLLLHFLNNWRSRSEQETSTPPTPPRLMVLVLHFQSGDDGRTKRPSLTRKQQDRTEQIVRINLSAFPESTKMWLFPRTPRCTWHQKWWCRTSARWMFFLVNCVLLHFKNSVLPNLNA